MAVVEEGLVIGGNQRAPAQGAGYVELAQETGEAYYLKADSGPVNHAWPAYKPRPYNRVVFYLVGSESSNVILPIPSPKFNFPDGADVIVLGCVNDNGDVEALSVLLTGESPSLFTREPMPVPTGPLPE